ncbi:MAG TPA: hypothetical protein PLH98_14745 [Ruminococcus flavefaciens]|nr:hypothetical protein [Ruminococcus flavefaciens]
MNLNFLCRCCKRRIIKKKNPEFIESAGLHETAYKMEWIKFKEDNSELPVTEREWENINDIPEVGETHILKIGEPFDEEIGAIFTNLFEPWQMAVNGWDCAESQEDIYKAAAVLCRFVDVIWSDDFSAYIHVEVVNVVLLSDLHKVLPVNLCDRPVELFDDSEDVWTEYEDEHWLNRNWTGQGDVGSEQLLYTDENGVNHEVMTSWYDFHDNTYTLSNNVSKPGAFSFGDRKRYIYLVSRQFRMGWGYMDSLHKQRQYFAFCGQTDGSLSVVLIDDTFRLGKDYPVGEAYNYKQAEEFRTKYIDGRESCEGENAVIREFVEEYLSGINE